MDKPVQQVARRPFPWHCSGCGKKEVYGAVTSHTCEVNHDGRLHTVEVPELQVGKCRACGEVCFDDFTDDQISAALRAKLRLLSPEQIRDAMKALGLRQKELAARLGVAEATMSRWCTGSLIQSRAMDNLMRVYFGIPEARAVLTGPEQDPSFGATVTG